MELGHGPRKTVFVYRSRNQGILGSHATIKVISPNGTWRALDGRHTPSSLEEQKRIQAGPTPAVVPGILSEVLRRKVRE